MYASSSIILRGYCFLYNYPNYKIYKTLNQFHTKLYKTCKTYS